MQRRLLLLLLLAIAVVLGGAREFLFLNLNYQLDSVAHQRTISYAHSVFRTWTHGMDLGSLVRLKWILALAFIALMMVLSILWSRIVFGDHRYSHVVVLGFLITAAIALLLQTISSAIPPLYGVSVKLLHLLQYPVVLVVIWAAALLPGRRGSP
jgi:hypothetical protein